MFPAHSVLHATAPHSDHRPIFIIWSSTHSNSRHRRNTFKFENFWANDSEWKEIISDAWTASPHATTFSDITLKLEMVSKKLQLWSRSKFGILAHKIRMAKSSLDIAQRNIVKDFGSFQQTRFSLASLLEHEETYWPQRSRTLWLKKEIVILSGFPCVLINDVVSTRLRG